MHSLKERLLLQFIGARGIDGEQFTTNRIRSGKVGLSLQIYQILAHTYFSLFCFVLFCFVFLPGRAVLSGERQFGLLPERVANVGSLRTTISPTLALGWGIVERGFRHERYDSQEHFLPPKCSQFNGSYPVRRAGDGDWRPLQHSLHQPGRGAVTGLRGRRNSRQEHDRAVQVRGQ